MSAQPGSSAVLSDDGVYRYELRRQWGAPGDPRVCWVMLNPSTADASVDDPTIRRCIGFSNRWGYGSLVVVNLFALRATDPKELACTTDPVGAGNDAAILAAAYVSERVVVAWGAHGKFRNRAALVTQMLTGPQGGFSLHCLGTTKQGAPRHPLYIRGEQALVLYRKGTRPAAAGPHDQPNTQGAPMMAIEHPGFVHMPDWQVTAARRALALARSMVLSGERMSPAAEAEIDAALGYLVPYDSQRPEPADSAPAVVARAADTQDGEPDE